MLSTSFFLFLFHLGHPLFAQTLVFGKITDAAFDAPLPYVNIGIPEAGIGTVSDEEGYYLLEIPTQFLDNEIRFSMVGFQPQKYAIAQIEGAN